MRTWRTTRSERVMSWLGAAFAVALVVFLLTNDRDLPIRLLGFAVAAWYVWELGLGVVQQVTVHEDGRVELRTPLRRRSVAATEITAVRRRAGDRRGKGPFVVRSSQGTWRVSRKLEPGVEELFEELRLHNPDIEIAA
jgi:hypothetical protein